MSEAFETIETNSRTVSCDGGGDLGHPKIYLEIALDKKDITCPYCSRMFVLNSQ